MAQASFPGSPGTRICMGGCSTIASFPGLQSKLNHVNTVNDAEILIIDCSLFVMHKIQDIKTCIKSFHHAPIMVTSIVYVLPLDHMH